MTTVDQAVVPLASPGLENKRLRAVIVAAMARVVDGGSYILGSEVKGFEAALAGSVGAAGAIGVGCGTEALTLALLALGIGPGDEVLAPSHTAGPTVAAINMIGATPVLVEVDPADYCIHPEAAAAAIGPRTRAIIAVHLYGHPADLNALGDIARKAGIEIVEDCAQAQGARIGSASVGAIGALGCFSFYPTKNLGAIGDAGAVTARDGRLVEKLAQLRTYGWTDSQFAGIEGGRCTRLDELQAAVLSVKLEHVEAGNERRRAIARRYSDELAGLPLALPSERVGTRHVYHLYVVRSERRDVLAEHLKTRGIMTGRHYPFPVHVQPGLAARARIPVPLELTDRLAEEILSLPMFPDMTDAQIDRVVTAIKEFFE